MSTYFYFSCKFNLKVLILKTFFIDILIKYKCFTNYLSNNFELYNNRSE